MIKKKAFNIIRLIGLFVSLLLVHTGASHAESVNVAVASNFAVPLRLIQRSFEEQTGHKLIISSGSTGQLYNQIIRGAPYDIFLSADEKRPALLINNGFALPESEFTYAIGRLALYTNQLGRTSNEAELKNGEYNRIAIANPSTAPYGAAALQTLTRLELITELEAKLVRGANIAQTYQFVETGNTNYGLVAYGQVKTKPANKVWLVPASYHMPIAQNAVLLNHRGGNEAAKTFWVYLQSAKATEIIKNYGYDVKQSSK